MLTDKKLFVARVKKMNDAKEASKTNPFGQSLTLDTEAVRECFKYQDGQLCEYELSNYFIEKCVENKFTKEITKKKINIVSLTEEEQAVVNLGVMEVVE